MKILFDFDDITLIPNRNLLDNNTNNVNVLKENNKFPFFIRGDKKIKNVHSLINNTETNIKKLQNKDDVFYEYTYDEAYTLFIENSKYFSKDKNAYVTIMLGNFNNKIIKNLSKIRTNFPKLKLTIGCVSDVETYILLSSIGIDYIIIGSGFSYLSDLKFKTGVCMPDANLLKLIHEENEHNFNSKIIAYPTFEKIQDLIKCFALGSDYVMIDKKIIKNNFNKNIDLFIKDFSKLLYDAILLSGFTKLSDFTSIKNYEFVPESHKKKIQFYFKFKEKQKWEKAKVIT